MIYALVGGIAFGCAITWFVHRDELKYLREELRSAQGQIAHAVMVDKAIIPPREVEIEPVPPLPPELQSVVDEWESPESRAVEESRIRGWMAEGYGPEAILRQYGAGA